MSTETLKPAVKYRKDVGHYIVVGGSASVFSLDHPYLGETFITTSKVVSYDSNTGEFETLNTRYVPA